MSETNQQVNMAYVNSLLSALRDKVTNLTDENLQLSAKLNMAVAELQKLYDEKSAATVDAEPKEEKSYPSISSTEQA